MRNDDSDIDCVKDKQAADVGSWQLTNAFENDQTKEERENNKQTPTTLPKPANDNQITVQDGHFCVCFFLSI